MLILECSQGCYGRTEVQKEGRTDASVTISLRNFVGEGIKKGRGVKYIKSLVCKTPIVKVDKNNKMNCELMLTYDTPALRQTGSRNLMGQKTLPTIWGIYMKLVTKHQISAINSC